MWSLVDPRFGYPPGSPTEMHQKGTLPDRTRILAKRGTVQIRASIQNALSIAILPIPGGGL